MFQTKSVEEVKTRFYVKRVFLPKMVRFMR